MRLVRKLQLAYLSLILVPPVLIISLVFGSWYLGSSRLGPYEDLEAPGWLKPELAAVMSADWTRYALLKEQVIIFVMAVDGTLLFPDLTEAGPVPESYPYLRGVVPGEQSGVPAPGSEVSGLIPPVYLPDFFLRYGTEWTVELSVTPIRWHEQSYMAGWRTPRRGVAGFLARRGWFFPLILLTGILLIPAYIDSRLRRSIRRLQDMAGRLSSGRLDEPFIVSPKDDLADLAQSLEAARSELKDGRDRRSRFLMAVSHDLRTPLTSIKGYVEALEDGMAQSPEDSRRYMSVLNEKAAILERRIVELIDFARSETGGWTRPSRPVDMADLFGRLNAAFSKDAGFAGRDFDGRGDLPAETVVDGDEEALYRCWENLFANALRHTGDGGRIGFRYGIGGSDGYLFGEIVDNGAGVEPDFVPQLFEPFARADRGRNTEGLGLGLASVKAVAEAHGGTVDYRPNPDGGSIFRIRIPCRIPSGAGGNGAI
jgi:two-component system sensor histidine kinase BaeS